MVSKELSDSWAHRSERGLICLGTVSLPSPQHHVAGMDVDLNPWEP